MSSVLDSRMQWLGHCGKGAKRRYLRQHWNRTKKLAAKDEAAFAARGALIEAAPDEETAMQWNMVAISAAEFAGCSWADAVAELLDQVAANQYVAASEGAE